MKNQEIISVLESLAPPSYQESYDNSGLIVGQRQANCTGVLISLDCTEEVVAEAIRTGCSLIVSHHPIVFKGLKRFNGADYVQRTVEMAIKNDIALYAIHTNLDNVSLGVNKRIGELMGLTNLQTLRTQAGIYSKLITFCPKEACEQVTQALFEAGCGEIGGYSECSYTSEGTGSFKAGEGTNPHVGQLNERHHEPENKIETIFPNHLKGKVLRALESAHPYDEVAYDVIGLSNSAKDIGAGMIGELESPMEMMAFLRGVKEKFNVDCVKHTELVKKSVKKVAFCGGSGSFLLKDAIRAGADLYVTGDFKYHEFFDAEDRIVIADIGHYESEQYTSHLLLEYLKEKFPTFALRLSEINTNPVNYLI